MVDERPTIAERYSSAIETSNLKVDPDSKRDVDFIIAAGWAGDGIGGLLLRLRTEFDTVKTEVRGSGDSDLTDRMLIMMRLKTLTPAVRALGELGTKQAEVMSLARPNREIEILIGQVLDIWLDPGCSPCEGRGYNGGGRHEHTGPQIICRPCGGTGNRKNRLGKDDEQRQFCQRILSLMEDAASRAEQKMRRVLRTTVHD